MSHMNQHRITQYRVTLSWTVDLDASVEQLPEEGEQQ